MSKLIARILFIPITAFFLFQVISIFQRSIVSRIFYYFDERLGIYEQVQPYFHIFTIIFVLWIIFQLTLEITAYLKNEKDFSYWLKHLRYAPIAALLFSFFIVPIFDAGMIEFSRWRIRQYVFSNSQTVEKPDIRLHNNDRGWCGNGVMAHESYLYYDTASEGLENENPSIRARALFITHEVADIFNGTDRKRFNAVLIKSCRDDSQIVRDVAESILNDREKKCLNFLNLK